MSARAAVLVSDAEARAALAAVRSLGRLGLEVIALAQRRGSLAGRSRYAARELCLPSAAHEPARWRDEVLALLHALPHAWLLPISEIACGTLLEGPPVPRALLPAAAAYHWFTDKRALLERAAELGLSVPPTRAAETGGKLGEAAVGLRFPLIAKSRRSRWLAQGCWQQGSAVRAGSAEALRALEGHPAFAAGALLQEYVPGSGEGLFFLSREGEVLARFAHRRLREKPPSGGVSVLSESIPVDAALARRCEQLLAEQRWSGVAMFEFRRAPDGAAYLMEVNPRLWGSLQLAIDAGVDFPALLWKMHRGEPLPAAPSARPARLRWLLGDLDHLWIALRQPEQRRASGRSAGAVLADFARGFFDGSRSEVLRRDDPAPFLADLAAWLR